MALRPASAARTRGAASAAAAGRARPIHWPLGAGLGTAEILAHLAAALAREAEERRLFPWLAVAFGLGILAWFAADAAPVPTAPAWVVVLAVPIAILLRHRRGPRLTVIVIAAVAAGFGAAEFRAAWVAAPRIERVIVAEVAGFLEVVDKRRDGARVLLRVSEVSGLAAEARPRRLRLVLRGRVEPVAGDFVRLKARLMPPPEPARPGGYDFARDAYFRGIGAVGSGIGPVTRAAPPASAPLDLALGAAIDRARNTLTDRIHRIVGGEAGALAAALVTGKRDLIGAETNDALRAAGLYHIVSISGLHMVLAAGVFFWTIRALLAALPGVALGAPIKKIAAIGAMLGAVAYCVFTGSEVATERSLIMVLVMLAAILVDRPALSMRNLAVAALLVLAREPETLLGPSFQMSFSAVAGLVAAAEWWRRRQPSEDPATSAWPSLVAGRIARAGLAILATTAVASLATAPFAAYHFQRVNPFGIVGNALALPFVSLVVMPAAVAGTVAYPFGLDGPVWWAMGQGTKPVLAVSDAVASWAGSVTGIAAFGPGALGLAALAILWLCLWTTFIRLAAILPAAAGIFLAANVERPDLVVARDGAGFAFRGADGRLAVVGRASRFDIAVWLQADGDTRAPRDIVAGRGADCDAHGCVARLPNGRAVALVGDAHAFPTDCRRADIVVSRLYAPAHCRPPWRIDRAALRDQGSTALRFTGAEARVEIVRGQGERRPWEPRRLVGREQAEPAPPPPAAAAPERRRRAPETVDPRADTPLDPPDE